MPFLLPAELSTHLFAEVSAEINRDDASRMQTAIDAAVAEALGYLTAYDTEVIFSAEEDGRNPILLLYVKDIAVWHFIQLANPGVDLQLRETRYEKAIAWLKDVQKGIANPSLPLPPEVENTPAENFVRWGGSNRLNYNF